MQIVMRKEEVPSAVPLAKFGSRPRLLRLKQYVKNGFDLRPPGFSGCFSTAERSQEDLVAAVLFRIASSAVWCSGTICLIEPSFSHDSSSMFGLQGDSFLANNFQLSRSDDPGRVCLFPSQGD